mmetsp:Transcript_44474/g.72412  ORF Transcript_44474/g.72412 Transcript_44474/m.72412 type:complete len:710 (-) Transcript_44474:226-2355(-)
MGNKIDVAADHLSSKVRLPRRDPQCLRELIASLHLIKASYETDVASAKECLRVLEGRSVPRSEYTQKVPFSKIQMTNIHAFQQQLWAEDDEDLYVCFRGTNELRDWAVNITMDATSDPQLGLVHKGWFTRASRVSISALITTANKLNKRLILCGHSLGGCVATIVLSKLLFEAEKGNRIAKGVHCYTFGAPQFSGNTLQRIFASKGWGQFLSAYIAEGDIVPYACDTVRDIMPQTGFVTPRVQVGFVHPSELLFCPVTQLLVLDTKCGVPALSYLQSVVSKTERLAPLISPDAWSVTPLEPSAWGKQTRGFKFVELQEIRAFHCCDNYLHFFAVLLGDYKFPNQSFMTADSSSSSSSSEKLYNRAADIAPKPKLSSDSVSGAYDLGKELLEFVVDTPYADLITGAELRYEQATYSHKSAVFEKDKMTLSFAKPSTACARTECNVDIYTDFYDISVRVNIAFARILLFGATSSGKTTLLRCLRARLRGAESPDPLPAQTDIFPNRQGESVVRFAFIEFIDRNGLERYSLAETLLFRADFVTGSRRPDLAIFCQAPLTPLLFGADDGSRVPAIKILLDELARAQINVLPVLTNIYSVDMRAILPRKLEALERALGIHPSKWIRVNTEEINGRGIEIDNFIQAVNKVLRGKPHIQGWKSGADRVQAEEIRKALSANVLWSALQGLFRHIGWRLRFLALFIILFNSWPRRRRM